MSFTREDILSMDMVELSDLLAQSNLQYDHLETLTEMQELYLMHTYQTSSESDENRPHQRVMEDIVANDRTMRVELSAIYDMFMKLLNESKDASCINAIMDVMHGEFNNTLTTFKDELINDECPIVVAGETSAGKSSILNLILGTDVLAHSLLGTTKTICRLHNSDTKRFEVHFDNDETVTVNRTDSMVDSDAAWKDALEPYLTGRDARRKCKQVDIYWPVPMLQKHVTIVDTPGIGETDSLTDVLLSYLPKAVAFIYVINSANAGGIQDDYLLRILNQQKVWAMEGRSMAMDYESTIFVCNKWDKVQQEEEIVWKNSLEKISANLPGFPVEQIFKMSVAEEVRRRKGGLVMTSKFGELLKGIEKLLALSMEGKIRKHYRSIELFLMEIQSKLLSRINHGKKEKDDSRKLLKDVMERLAKLSTDAAEVKTQLIEVADQECCKMVDGLYAHLQKKEVREYVLTSNDDDIPDVQAMDFWMIKFLVERNIQSRIKDVIFDWEKSSQTVKGASERLREKFLSECKLLGKECYHINLLIEGDDEEDIQEELSASNYVQTATENPSMFTSTEKAIIALTSPLWFPLVTAATILVLPLAIGIAVKETIQERLRREHFIKNKSSEMRKWAQMAIDTAFTKSYIRRYIFEAYNDVFVRKIDSICSDIIPKQIEADRKLIHDILRDERSSKQIVEKFTPMLNEIRVILGKLRLYQINFWNRKTALTQRQLIYKGKFSDVFKARWMSFDNTESDVAVKVFNDITYENVTESTLEQLDEIEHLRKLKHRNIVEVYGICCSENEDNEDNKLTIVLELCEGSLKDIVFTNESLQCWKFCTTERHDAFEFYLNMAIGVCNGLMEIHKQRYLHGNLELSNVLVKNQTAKLCDLAFARSNEVNSITHMSPEFLRSERYTSSTDIYSLGILLWELWYGRSAFTEDEYDRCTSHDLLKAIKTGTRPKLTYGYCPSTDLQALIKECWDSDPTKRPNAFQVVCILRDIQLKETE